MHISLTFSGARLLRVCVVAAVHVAVDYWYLQHMQVPTQPGWQTIALAAASYLAIAFALTAPAQGTPLLQKAAYVSTIVWPLCWWVFNSIILCVSALRRNGWSHRHTAEHAAAIDTLWGLAVTLSLAAVDHLAFPA